jgi:hypothetical protein
MATRDAKTDKPITVWIDKQDGTWLKARVLFVEVNEHRQFEPPVGVWGQNASPWPQPVVTRPRYTIKLEATDLFVTDGVNESPYQGFAQRPKTLCVYCGTRSHTSSEGKCVNCNGPKG